MLNQHEVVAHNRKVALKAADKLIDRLDPVVQMAERERREERLKKALPLPKIDPNARAPRKIYMGGRNVGTRSHNVRSAMPTPADRRNRQVQGITNFAR